MIKPEDQHEVNINKINHSEGQVVKNEINDPIVEIREDTQGETQNKTPKIIFHTQLHSSAVIDGSLQADTKP